MQTLCMRMPLDRVSKATPTNKTVEEVVLLMKRPALPQTMIYHPTGIKTAVALLTINASQGLQASF